MISRPEMSSVANLEAFSLDTISSGFEEEMEDDQMDLPEDESSSSFSGGSPSYVPDTRGVRGRVFK